MVTRYFGARITRNEDARLLTGQALFVDDVELPGMLHVAFLRSPHAHARIARDRRLARRGAREAWSRSTPRRTSATTGGPGRCWCRRRRSRARSSTSARRCRSPRTRCATSASRWRSWSPRAATSPRMPLADIVVDFEPLPAVVDLEAALAPARRACTTTSRGNVAAHVRQSQGRLRRRARSAPTASSRRRFRYDHGASSPIETRGVVAQWDARGDRLTVWDTTQAPVFRSATGSRRCSACPSGRCG